MRIAWLTNNINQLGGVEQVICGLSSYYSTELKHEVEIISINSSQSSVFYPLDESVQIRHCGLDWREQTFRKLWTLVGNIMRKLDADILLTCHPTISYAALLNKHKFKGKVVVTEHISCDYYSRKRLYCNAALYRFADQFVVLTESNRDQYLKLGCRSIVIPNANFRPTDFRARLDNKIVLAAGRIEAVKGFDRLVEAFAQIAKKHPDWKLCICGSGTMESNLKAQVEILGITDQVIFPGSVKNMNDYYLAASIFALSSHHEGFPLVLVEAVSYGLPSVCFEIPATAELLADGGGILVPQGNISEFAKKLDLLMSDAPLRNRLGDEAYEASKKYSVAAIADRWIQLFRSLTAG